MAEILQKEGTFKAMELKIKKIRAQEERNSLQGGWHTEISLKALNWTQSLGSNSHSHGLGSGV